MRTRWYLAYAVSAAVMSMAGAVPGYCLVLRSTGTAPTGYVHGTVGNEEDISGVAVDANSGAVYVAGMGFKSSQYDALIAKFDQTMTFVT